MNETLNHFVTVVFTVVIAAGLSGCGDKPSSVDTTPFLQAIDGYLDSSNMGMAVKDIKEGPVIDGDTACLTTSLSRKDIGGPAVTWTFHFNRKQDGKWSVVRHDD